MPMRHHISPTVYCVFKLKHSPIDGEFLATWAQKLYANHVILV
jgi:hypothetical protein